MVNYNNGKIYKIENNIDNEIYIGSTTKQYLSQRMDNHRSNYKSWKSGKSTKVMVFDMFDKHGIENCKIVLLELVNCNTKDELLAREAFYIKNLVCVNKYIPLRTQKEYYNDNIEKLLEHKKQYYNDNKDKKKKYYNDNKEKILEERKQYYNDNKKKYTCACGKMICINYKSSHEKSIIHFTYLENKIIEVLYNVPYT